MELAEFAKRRQQLMAKMGEKSVALIPAAPIRHRSGSVDYPYRQDSDFYYLCGFPEPQALAVLIPGRPEGEFILFNQERDPEAEIWTGARIGQQGAHENYKADEAHSIHAVDTLLPKLLMGKTRLYYPFTGQGKLTERIMTWVNKANAIVRVSIGAPSQFYDLRKLVHEMRLIKSEHEIDHLRKAAQISAAAHKHTMQVCRSGLMEYELEAELLREFMCHGCRYPAYNSIVGGGANACVLHYEDNNAELQNGDLVLIDAGGEYEFYAADITRTFPVSGRFSTEQKAVYEVVLKAQQAIIERIAPGLSWYMLQQTAVQIITEGLVALGLLQGELNTLLEQQAGRKFFLHSVSHWLGMDVHDVSEYKVEGKWRSLEPGMVFTVEPGIYIPANMPGVDKRWWNIGIRIEDDVLVKDNGCEVLSKDAPKTIEDIENCMKS